MPTKKSRKAVRPRPPFEKILVANRGEIAVRVMRACAEMGIKSVAVYSDVDRTALHVRFAHEAYPIGPPAPAQSYLNIPKIIEVARKAGADAVHPGYGFLSENAEFARAVNDAGLTFIGPPPEAMEAVGDKVRARELMLAAGVPVVPGTPPLDDDIDAIVAKAEEIGYPVLLKAAAGGGGKGMRLVESSKEMKSALAQARGEAATAFGDDRVFLEKFVVRPRHIEFQILADRHGNCVHLLERECSIQRRHQKLIEECPSPVIDEKTRAEVGELAVKAVQAAGYVNAGTVEFLRGDDGSFYFMEVNARLQVEHPVTEVVTGIDLVKAMIRVAAGEKLPWKQDDIERRGHAIECRIIAEDPARNFMPAPGTITGLRTPAGPGVRYDDATYAGWTVPVHYDPMIAKLVSWGRDRHEAIERMTRALNELRIDGLTTSV
ncbi:MAG: acetyl-CoA carboxylase biotin carboxylase subunit, partial [Acidobacteria bacterium]|nr:acetyl-CoA carboxylase biotin carboxylase subunit [Acidobacteriota bacterium]NIM60449.1 acetyl-CoA carboxylase biotin carboxylase subunit [Acidobacteriota bacterium]NIO59667.1 acetyl-CoA carboxylase biotin carboxylase subunit [Acidobacteriota bacterium]NIQ30761.1 acetyl-CoA carboxylase biotin carboxylase subunit [Acidobacteriota bacterium]NIQ84386.1 acetyl-CoA carboxylase biotin carboxylase subunit [Acidobacteriota bacterium]